MKPLRYRQVHLDFHTSEAVPSVGDKFDKAQFQAALKAGHVDSITVFSKCHHGWAYHPSTANLIHPKLNGFDLTGAQLEACREICEMPEYTRLCSLCAKYENYSTEGFMDFKFSLGEGRVESYSLIDRRYVKLPSSEPKKKSFALFKKSVPEEPVHCANLNPARGDGYESLNVAALSELSRVFRTVADSIFDKFLHLGRQLAFYRALCALISFYEEKVKTDRSWSHIGKTINFKISVNHNVLNVKREDTY